MISKEEFLQVLSWKKQYDSKVDDLENIFHSAYIYESDIIDIPYRWFDTILKTNFSEEGRDILDDYLYENTKKYVKADGTIIEINSDEDLWNLVNNFGCN